MLGSPGFLSVHSNLSRFRVGVNLSCLENGNRHFTDNLFPGIAYTDYGVPNTPELDYYKTKGWTFIRLPFLWDRLQVTLGGALDTTYLGYLQTIVNYAGLHGMTCLLDCHNYTRRYIKQTTVSADASSGATTLTVASLSGVSTTSTLTMTYPTGGGNTADVQVTVSGSTVTLAGGATLSAAIASGSYVAFWDMFGTTNVTVAHFADLWSRLATVFAGNPGLGGYDLCNEPVDCGETVWVACAQAAINTIRLVDTKTSIYVEGYFFATAGTWTANNPHLHTITDPNQPIIWSCHCYLDRDSSGTHYYWADEVANGVTTATGVNRLANFFGWLVAHGFTHSHIGEMGAGNDDPAWLTSLDNCVAAMKAIDCEFTYWVVGQFWGTYEYAVEQQNHTDGTGLFTQDAIQTAVLTKYTGAAQPTQYFLTGPVSGNSGVASASFTAYYRGLIKNSVTITPSDSGAGGTFAPTSLTFSPGFNGQGTFTYTAPAVNLYSVSVSNTAGWSNPAAVGFSTQPDLFTNATATPTNILSFRKMRGPYGGPLVRLQRSSDSAQQDFYAVSQAVNAYLDTAAVATWSGASTLTLVRWYSQDGSGANDGTAPVETDNQVQYAGPLPTFILDRGDGKPTVRYTNNAMECVSPLDGLTGHTIFVAMNPTSLTSDTGILDWRLIQVNSFGTPGTGSAVWHTDVDPDVAMNMVTGRAVYAGRWRGNTTNGKQTYVNGTLAAQATTTRVSLTDQFRSNATIGWARYTAATFVGDVSEIIIFSGAVSDTDITNISSNMASANNGP
jgi:hypothetical protein